MCSSVGDVGARQHRHEEQAPALGYALGYAAMELSSLSITTDAAGEDAAFEGLLALGRTLPADLPPELAQVARAVCLADLDRQFEFGLQALLAGIEA